MENEQAELVALLKKKGTGSTMGKALCAEELQQLPALFSSKQANLVTKATLLTAILMLAPTAEEKLFLDSLRQDPSCLPPQLNALIKQDASSPFEKLTLKVLNGDHLDWDQARNAFEALFVPTIPDYLKAVFLESLRLKRETDIENAACFSVLSRKISTAQVNVPLLLDIADPYDGFNRNLNLGVFLAPLLAALGVPVILHGIDECGPKRGINAYKILAAAKKNPHYSLNAAGTAIENPRIGWAYIDQSASFPALFSLKPLRQAMVKRPCLSTVEKLLRPLRSSHRDILFTSYTHPPYRDTLTTLLKADSTLNDFIIVRGLEGSTQLPLDRRCPYLSVVTGVENSDFVRPEDFQVTLQKCGEETDFSASNCLAMGTQALKGQEGFALDFLVYNAAYLLANVLKLPIPDASKQVRGAIQSGTAFAHWERGLC